MYWIEVSFENGKTLRKESDNINDTYKVWARYYQYSRQPRVQSIKAGVNNNETGNWNLVEGIVI